MSRHAPKPAEMKLALAAAAMPVGTSARTCGHGDRFGASVSRALCHGTGKRTDLVAQANPHLKERCNGCRGTGQREPYDKWYRFSLEHLAEFGRFLSDCGGFEIH